VRVERKARKRRRSEADDEVAEAVVESGSDQKEEEEEEEEEEFEMGMPLPDDVVLDRYIREEELAKKTNAGEEGKTRIEWRHALIRIALIAAAGGEDKVKEAVKNENYVKEALEGLFNLGQDHRPPVAKVVRKLYINFPKVFAKQTEIVDAASFHQMFENDFFKAFKFLNCVVCGSEDLYQKTKVEIYDKVDEIMAGCMVSCMEGWMEEESLSSLPLSQSSSMPEIDEDAFWILRDDKNLEKNIDDIVKAIKPIQRFEKLSKEEDKAFADAYHDKFPRAKDEGRLPPKNKRNRLNVRLDEIASELFDSTFEIGGESGTKKSYEVGEFTTSHKFFDKEKLLEVIQENKIEVYIPKQLFVSTYAVANSKYCLENAPQKEFVPMLKQMLFARNADEQGCGEHMEEDEVERCLQKLLPLYWKHVQRLWVPIEAAFQKMVVGKNDDRKRCLVHLEVEATQRTAPGSSNGEEIIKTSCMEEIRRTTKQLLEFCAKNNFGMVVQSKWMFEDMMMMMMNPDRNTSYVIDGKPEKWLDKCADDSNGSF